MTKNQGPSHHAGVEQLILASGSPRRKEILDMLGIPCAVMPPDLDESVHDDLPPRERVLALAQDKARAVAARLDTRRTADGRPCRVLAADTLVYLPSGPDSPADDRGMVLGKPADRTQAALMLALIAARRHEVYTGMALLNAASGECRLGFSRALVSVAPMSEAEIEGYLQTGEWEGAAGSYRLQGRGACFIEGIEGSWSCIVGLPIRELYVMLRATE